MSKIKKTCLELTDLTPEQRLLVAVMESAHHARDIKYFESDTFKLHCKFLKLNDEYVYRKYLEQW